MAGTARGSAAGANGRQRQAAAAAAHEFEFFGPYLGPLGIMLGLPAVCYALVYACNASGCMHLAPSFTIPGFPAGQRLFTWEALAVYCAWFAAQAALHLLLPGQLRQGVALPDGSRLPYKLNGAVLVEWRVDGGRWLVPAGGAMLHAQTVQCSRCPAPASCFRRSASLPCVPRPPHPLIMCPPLLPAGLQNLVLSLAAVAYFGFWRRGALPLSWVYDNYVPLMTAAVLFSFALSAALYASSFAPGRLLAAGGATGHHLYDFFIGRELNPRIGGFDLKEFCELYPGG